MNKEKREEKKLKKAIKYEIRNEKRLEEKEKKAVIREKYADEAAIVRFLHVYASILTKCVAWAIVICAAVFGGKAFIHSNLFSNIVNSAIDKHIEKIYAAPAPDEIYEMSPIDEEGAARIAEIPGNDPKDTWTFCVYMVGADLEDCDEDDLSDYVKMSTMGKVEENRAKKREDILSKIERFSNEVLDNGIDMPKYLYKIDKPIESSTYVTEDVIVADMDGCASTDIAEMCAEPLPDNITIVIQTGGARRWSNALINPNRTQRFVIKNGVMDEVMDMHLQDSCDPDTLADFISFCDENYSSDHMGLIMWDHGGGVTGYGVDQIFDTGMSLADINRALAKSLKKNVEDPYFDLIGFDACLMAATDTATCLEGYGKYLAASEETEPGDGWDHTAWLRALADDPTMNGAQIGQAIADSYMDYYLKGNADYIYSTLAGNLAVTFSVTDIEKAAKVDAAYEKMNEKFLKLIADDQSVLTDMGRCAAKTMRYAGHSYGYFNTIDLGTYIDYLSELYPDECQEVRTLLKESVLYTRSNHYLAGSQGLSVYFPVEMNDASGLFILTDYVYNISNKKCTNALYYYKVAGCLNDDLRATVHDITGKDLKTINTQIFYDYQSIEPEITDDNEMVIYIGDDLQDRIQDVCALVASYDADSDMITYYGTDDRCEFDGEGNIVADVDAKWFALDGSLLAAELSFTTETTSTYIAKVLHNDIPSYMTFTVNNETDEITIDKLVKIPEYDSLEYDAALRVDTELNYGDKIVPILLMQSGRGDYSVEALGDKVKYKRTSGIELVDLPEGEYLQTIMITDLRGDEYYSPVAEAAFKNGKVTNLGVNPAFAGIN